MSQLLVSAAYSIHSDELKTNFHKKLRRSPGFSSAVRQMPGDLYTAPWIISLSPLSLAIDGTDVTLGVSGLWLGTLTEDDGNATQA